MQNDLESSLIEVRKAYRLLADYQKRVLDLAGFIGNSFGRTYAGGYSKYCNPTPRNGKGNLGLWSWDWLNMYFYEFHFGTEEIDGNNIIFSILIVSDTGYYEKKKEYKKLQKLDTELFSDVKESDTRLIFIVGKNMWHLEGVFSDSFNNPKLITGKCGLEEKNGDRMIFKSYSLSDFSNQLDAENNLKDFENFCLDNKIDFKLIERKI